MQKLASIGIQLYTVRRLMDRDVPYTLRQLAQLGYREAEFAGYYDYSSSDIRLMLADNGMTSPSAHVSLDAIRTKPDFLIQYASEVGHKYLVVAWLPESERQTLDQYRTHAALFNHFAEQCRASGIQFAYHNHDVEFQRLEGALPIDVLMTETDRDLVQYEIDFYWITKAGQDPLAHFKKYPGRFPLCHVKDMDRHGAMHNVGSGEIDFGTLFAASGAAGLKHYFVEHDNPSDAMESAAQSYDYLSRMRF